VLTPERRVIGIVTDGDLRRAFAKGLDLRSLVVADIMGQKPHAIGPDHLAVEAVQMMEQYKINQLPVVDESGILLGALNMHDLFRAKVI
jgi:arabinose-5-phosphate isomerase